MHVQGHISNKPHFFSGFEMEGWGERGKREDKEVDIRRAFFLFFSSCFLTGILACLFSGAEEKIRLKSQKRMK